MSLEPEIDAGAQKSRSHIHGVRENVCREGNWRRKGGQAARGNRCYAEIGPKVFPFDRQVVRKVLFASKTCNPPWPGLIDGRALMGCCKRIRKQRGVFHIGDGSARGSIKHKVSKNHADAGPNSKQPACLSCLGHGERGRRATRIRLRDTRGSAQVHDTVIGFKAKNKIFPLEVVSSRASGGKAIGIDYLVAGAGDCRGTAGSEIAGWTKTGGGIHFGPAESATYVGADIKALEFIVRGVCRANGKKYKRKRTRSL